MYAHRDVGLDNLFVVEFWNGGEVVKAYNDLGNASRILVGFPTVVADGVTGAFVAGLGVQGVVVPCYFETGADYVTPIAGKSL